MTPLRLGSHYQLEERIGEGGIGVVWRGSDTLTDAAYAIKLLRPEHAQDPATVARFVRERTALLRFRHPNVVVLHDMIVEGDQLALVMDLVADGDLAAHRKRHGGTLGPAAAMDLMAQVCAALAAAHAAGIVHRDLKPANILLDGGQVRLTDFGIALVAGDTSITTEGEFLGTLHYLAPEVIRGEEPTPACDCYAVGVTLYELLAGHPPFTGVPAAVMHGHLHLAPERPDGTSDAAWQVIAACLEKDPARRPDATELEFALRNEARPPTVPGSRRSAGWPGLTAAWDRDTATRETALESGPAAIAVLADTGLAAGPPVTGLSADGAQAGGSPPAEGPVPPGGAGGPRRRGRLLGLGLAAGLLAAALAGVIAFALSRSPGTPGAAGTVAGSVSSSGHASTPGRSPAAAAGTSPQAGAPTPGTPTGTGPGKSPGPGGTSKPSASRTASASPTVSSSDSPASSTSPAPSASATASTSASPSATPSPSPTAPADTAWKCGPSAPATLATGKATGQKLQACIRVHNGRLALHGVLGATVKAWHEQIILQLEDSAGTVTATYYSPVCTTVSCTFTVTTVPADGQWTVVPEWARYGGNIMSAGGAPGYVDF